MMNSAWLFMVASMIVALPIHWLIIHYAFHARRAAPARDWLWCMESVMAVCGGALLSGFVAVLALLLFDACLSGHALPFAPLVLVFGQCYTAPVGLIVGIFAHWRWRRFRIIGRCSRCGYDLTGNTSGLCSECGLPVDQ